MPVFVLIPCYFDYYSFAVLCEVREVKQEPPALVCFFSQDCFGNSRSLMVPFKF